MRLILSIYISTYIAGGFIFDAYHLMYGVDYDKVKKFSRTRKAALGLLSLIAFPIIFLITLLTETILFIRRLIKAI